MKLSDALLPEFDHEMVNTRRTLERVPEEKLDWKPHPKSGSLGWLATHLALLPNWATMTLQLESLDIAPPGGTGFQMPRIESRDAVLKLFDQNVAGARAALVDATDEHLHKPWTLLSGGHTVLKMPRIAVLRNLVMNHMIHHRAQLGVYLRLNDVPVPALYGPSADEGTL